MAELATLEQLAIYRGVTFDPDDAQASQALEAAEQVVRTETGQHISLVTDEDIVLDGPGTRHLVLPEKPAPSITTIAWLDEDDVETEVAEFRLDIDAAIAYRKDGIWPLGTQNLVVTYTHGYQVIPDDINGVVLSLASRILSRSGGGTVSSEAIGTYSVTYADPSEQAGLLDIEVDVLAHYSSPAPY